MKRFGLGLLAAGMIAAATAFTALPASALGLGAGPRLSGTSPADAPLLVPARNGGGYGGGNWGQGNWGQGNWGQGNWGQGGWGQGGWGQGRNPCSWPGACGHGNNWHGNNWHGNGWNNWHRNGWYNGPRYPYRYPGFNYFYGGFWYPAPWWTFNYYGGEGYVGDAYGTSQHVDWCMNRYRSYNPRTNTYMGYDGRRHACNSPFD